jgi:hypothetical protein
MTDLVVVEDVQILTQEVADEILLEEVEVIEIVTAAEQGPPGPPGPGGGSTYTHTQAIPLAIWTAAHNLGRYPSVSVVDTLGRQVFGDVTWVDENIVQITHGGAIAGKAYFN